MWPPRPSRSHETFFTASGQPRFGLSAAQIPAELAAPSSLPALAGVATVAGDVLFYIMSTSEAAVATFERGLSQIPGNAITAVSVELGFQRDDGREPFGFLDGLRNVPSAQRPSVVFVDAERSPRSLPGPPAAATSPT